MTKITGTRFVAMSVGTRSGLTFYVTMSEQTGSYNVYVGDSIKDGQSSTALPKYDLVRQPDRCRCPDPTHNSQYDILYKGSHQVLDTYSDCIPLNPSDYTIDEHPDHVVITKKSTINVKK